MSPVAEEKDVYRASFERFAQALAQADTPWLRPVRTAAMARFTELGFPTTKQEEWKYTSVAAIARTVFVRPAEDGRVTREALRPLGLEGLRPREIVFVNGRFSAELSTLRPDGVRVESLRELLAREPGRLQPYLTRHLHHDSNPFALLNTAFLEDGAVVEVEAGAEPKQPIHLVYYSSNPGAEPSVSYPRTLVLVRRGGEATLVESYLGPDGQPYFTDAVTEVVLEDGAGLDHYKVQREGLQAFHVASMGVTQARDSRFSSHSLSLGGALVRNDVNLRLSGEGGDCVLNGLFLADGAQHVDNHTRIEHAVPHCSSRELYKGILDGRARGVFHGRIIVSPGAQKTDAYQTNKNLLLSKEALVQSTPQLEIFADDVKCKHGSTTGQLDEASLFYLRSRGIGEAAARSLLTYAFASDIVHRVRVGPLREALSRHLQNRLPAAGEIREAVA